MCKIQSIIVALSVLTVSLVGGLMSLRYNSTEISLITNSEIYNQMKCGTPKPKILYLSKFCLMLTFKLKTIQKYCYSFTQGMFYRREIRIVGGITHRRCSCTDARTTRGAARTMATACRTVTKRSFIGSKNSTSPTIESSASASFHSRLTSIALA